LHLRAFVTARKVQRNYNTLIGRYPGADGMEDRLHLCVRLQPRRHGDP